MRPVRPIFQGDAEFERLRRRLRLAVGSILLVTLVGVLGFVLIGGNAHDLIDAISMTVITLTTVGFGEFITSGRTRLEQRVQGRWRKSRS